MNEVVYYNHREGKGRHPVEKKRLSSKVKASGERKLKSTKGIYHPRTKITCVGEEPHKYLL